MNETRIMKDKNYTTVFTVDQSREEVFNAVNNVRGWWSGELEGDASKLGGRVRGGAAISASDQEMYIATNRMRGCERAQRRRLYRSAVMLGQN